jgi:hypothetical protein
MHMFKNPNGGMVFRGAPPQVGFAVHDANSQQTRSRRRRV